MRLLPILSNTLINLTTSPTGNVKPLSKLRYEASLDDIHRPLLKSLLQFPGIKRIFKTLLKLETARQLTNKNRDIFMAQNKQTVIGEIDLMPYKRPILQPLIRNYRNKKTAYLENFAVLKNYRGQGVGKYLLNTAEQQAKQQGFEEIIFPCSKKNRPLYEHLGYQSVKHPLLRLWLRWPLPNLLLLKSLGYSELMRKNL